MSPHRAPAATQAERGISAIKGEAPVPTSWLPPAVLLASALWAALVVASIWLGTDTLETPHAGGDGRIHSMAVLSREPLRLLRGYCGVTALMLTTSLMTEAYQTARFRERRPRFKRLWVHVVWVLPVANLWLPRIVFDRLWAANEGSEAEAPTRRGAVRTWWPLWLMFSVGCSALFAHDVAGVYSMYSEAPAAENPDLWFWLRVLVTLCAVPAYLAWWRVVHGLGSAVRAVPRGTPSAAGVSQP